MQKKNLILTAFLVFTLSLVGVYVYAQVSGVSHHPLEVDCKSELCIKSNGVGIGTTNPGAKLDVNASATGWGGWYEAIRLSQSAHSAITHPGGGLLFGLHSNRNFYWADTSNGWYSMVLGPTGALDVRDKVWIRGASNGWGTTVINGRVWSSSDNIHLSPPGGSAVYIDGNYREAGGGTGNVNLYVSGTIRASDVYGAGGQNIIVGDDTFLTDIDQANTLRIQGMQNGALGILQLGWDGPYIHSVLDTYNSSNGIYLSPSRSGYYTYMKADVLYTGQLFTTNALNGKTCPSGWTCEVMTHDVSAQSIKYWGSLVGPSSRTYKKDFTPYKGNFLTKIENVKPYLYRLKSENNSKKHFGYLAEDLPAEILDPNGKDVDILSYEGMLLKLIQEQQEEIKSLEKRLEELENGNKSVSKSPNLWSRIFGR